MADDRHFLRLEVVSPDGLVFDGDVAMVIVPADRGEMGILPRHAPIVARLSIGEIRIKTLQDTWLSLAVAEGFVKVQFDKVIVLADAAELATEIDVPRAEEAFARAQERLALLKSGGAPEDDEIDPFRETMALKRAKNRLTVTKKS
ncbi:MAG TPA: ATP synthase F1 subunit epsilon [Thermoleophilia bacterium]|nr:ATP synthase F1 subunit epsilon [Thermoleophilia bacterium]